MQRIAMVVEFNGKPFHGWQKQSNAITVQEALESALGTIEGRAVSTVGAGRTDAGVNAEAMLVHADISSKRWQRSPRAYTQGLNRLLDKAVSVVGVCAVESEFHARFSCTQRSYRYQIWNRSTRSALAPWRHWWMPRSLDDALMQKAADYLLGQHDFSAFQGSGCQAHSAVRELRQLAIHRRGYEVFVEVSADGFLYHMVRNIVGSLVKVGIGQWQPEYIAELLELGNRSLAGATAPAQGLYFVDALYPDFSAQGLIGKESKL
ncbi:MAG: tRNA pseudouridine(38-40) synthase TruA [Mariprofundaceae bacterium]